MGKRWLLLRTAGLAVMGFMLPRILVAAGVPLEQWAKSIGSRLGAAGMISTESVLVVLGLIIAAALMTAELWWQPVGRLVLAVRGSGGAQPSNSRMSLLDLYREAAQAGWDFGGNAGHIFDLAAGLRQAGADGKVEFSGTRIDRVPALTEDGFYEDIPKDYWYECSISATSPFKWDNSDRVAGIHADNNKTETYNPFSGFDRLVYRDLQVNRGQASKWLKTDASSYKGRYGREVTQ